MNLRKMQYFVDAVELENFSMVAKKNYISQTAISQQIMVRYGIAFALQLVLMGQSRIKGGNEVLGGLS